MYDQALEAILLELGLDARGVAGSSGWQLDGNLLRSSLRRLRGICTHPQVSRLCVPFGNSLIIIVYLKVGQLQRPGDKLYKPGTVKTIDDVLQV